MIAGAEQHVNVVVEEVVERVGESEVKRVYAKTSKRSAEPQPPHP